MTVKNICGIMICPFSSGAHCGFMEMIMQEYNSVPYLLELNSSTAFNGLKM